VSRPVTLFTGQWADLPLEDLAAQHCEGTKGFRTILVTEPEHPFVHEIQHRDAVLRSAASGIHETVEYRS
jgi:hypothetical protein